MISSQKPLSARGARSAEARPLARRAALGRRFAVLLALCCCALAATGCIGAAVGTAIDSATDVATYPIHEYVCAGAYKYDNADDGRWRELADDRERDHGEELVGVAVSGGGSRAAYFFASVMGELARVHATRADGSPASSSLLDEIDYVSGVSGGGLGAAYYVLNRPTSSDPRELDAFFDRFRAAMRGNFEADSLVRTFVCFYWVPLLFTYYHRGHLMASVFDERLFGGKTFADLPPARPPFPELVLNATSYSSGDKFLFTRLSTARFDRSRLYGYLRGLRLSNQGYFEGHLPLSNRGFDTIDSDLARFRIALAVVASAAVPNLLGPVVLRDHRDEDAYEVLGDGGIYDNYGLETLLQLFAARMEEQPGLPARILIVDGSGFFGAQRQQRRYTDAGYADRTYSIGAQRTASYAEAVCDWMRTYVPSGFDASPYRNLRLQVVSLYHQGKTLPDEPLYAEPPRAEPSYTAAQPGADGSVSDATQSASGTTEDPLLRFLANFNREVRGIGTRFRLRSREAALVKAQAKRVVREVLGSP